MEDTSTQNVVASPPGVRRRGEPWALGTVIGYSSASIFDRLGVQSADPLMGPVLRGLPSLLLGIILVWKHRTLDQMRPRSPRYIGRRAILAFVARRSHFHAGSLPLLLRDSPGRRNHHRSRAGNLCDLGNSDRLGLSPRADSPSRSPGCGLDLCGTGGAFVGTIGRTAYLTPLVSGQFHWLSPRH